MAQNVLIGAPSFVQGMGQFRHPVEGSVFIDRLGQLYHGGRQLDSAKGQRPKRVAKNVTHQDRLGKKLASLGAEKRITGNSGLGAAGGIAGSDFGLGGGSVPTCLTSGPLTCEPGGTQFVRASKSIGKSLRSVHRRLTIIVDQIPVSMRAGDSEQT
jgi:hypothetical protein